jgi:hypothetical protein
MKILAPFLFASDLPANSGLKWIYLSKLNSIFSSCSVIPIVPSGFKKSIS